MNLTVNTTDDANLLGQRIIYGQDEFLHLQFHNSSVFIEDGATIFGNLGAHTFDETSVVSQLGFVL